MEILEVKNIKKIYTRQSGGEQHQVLSNISFSVDEGEFIAIMGESGSGKTTLLNILASLDKPTSGQILLNNENIVTLDDKTLAKFRREELGFVFQDFNLLDTFSIKDNIFLPMVLSGRKVRDMEEAIEPIVNRLGIKKLLSKYPYEVSGGEKQRTAVARALITHPKILLADEPTGSLDSKSSNQLLDILSDENQLKQTILMVTHSVQAASRASRVLFIKDGEIFHQIYKGDLTDKKMFEKISDTLTVLVSGGE